MIHIKPSVTADTRTCDWSKVTEDELLKSSRMHIYDIKQALGFFSEMLRSAYLGHDRDKLSDIDGFFRDFQTGFKETTWWDRHRKVSRHHLQQSDGIPEDVNLIDVLEMIADCVMAGMARSGSVRPLEIDPEILMRAFQNTAALLQEQTIIDKD